MPAENPSSAAAELSSAEANRLFYATQAAQYDETEFCAIDEAPRRSLRNLLEQALALIPADEPAVLDAGGGTGNASLMLFEMDLRTTLVDTSPEMIARYEDKAAARGLEPVTELGDLEALFVEDDRSWDLIVFSSVLHHLEHPASMLAAAAGRLRPGGVIATLFDPLTVDRTGHLLRKLDYACWIALHSPATLLGAIARRLRPSPTKGAAPSVHIPELAERHAMSGLDDSAIRERAEAAGLVAREHTHLYDARYRWVVAASHLLRRPTHFSFLLQRPPGAG